VKGSDFFFSLSFSRETILGFELNEKSLVAEADLVWVDEVSMVGAELGRDLLSFGTKVLVVGDRNQLPPIAGTGYFTAREPDFMLREVHRQAVGNPIIHLATMARLGQQLQIKNYGTSSVIPRYMVKPEDLLQYDQIICGTHKTRCATNHQIRKLRGFAGDIPNVGERVICLKNDKSRGVLNGTIWTVLSATPDGRGFLDMVIEGDTGIVLNAIAPIAAFNAENGDGAKLPGSPFTFAYAITCHKAQGSEWDSVALIDESRCWERDGHARHWLYTGITRAAERVTIIM
jgi:exodeoxyribonuclease-5